MKEREMKIGKNYNGTSYKGDNTMGDWKKIQWATKKYLFYI
jgi:hypothetical protein